MTKSFIERAEEDQAEMSKFTQEAFAKFEAIKAEVEELLKEPLVDEETYNSITTTYEELEKSKSDIIKTVEVVLTRYSENLVLGATLDSDTVFTDTMDMLQSSYNLWNKIRTNIELKEYYEEHMRNR